VPQLLAHQGQPHEFLVLVPVADDEMVGALVEPEHRLELRLAAALQPDAERGAELDDLLHHVALLVHLHRVDGGVGALVAEFLDGVAELARERLNAGPQDIGKAQQQRKPYSLRVQVHRQMVEVEPALPAGIGMDGDVAFRIDPEEAEAPAAHVVELFCVLRGPSRRGDGGGDSATPVEGERAIVMMAAGEGKRRGRPAPDALG
jgi:hypothetical protein